MRPNGERPTVEYVEDLLDPDAMPELTGCQLVELTADELVEVAVRTPNKSLLLDVVILSGSKIAEAAANHDRDSSERWRSVTEAIEAIWAGSNDPEAKSAHIPNAIIRARTEDGEPLL